MKEITVTKAPLARAVREADDPEYATNLRWATLTSTVGSAHVLDDIRAVDDIRAGVLVSR
jgi:hypothetical protein